MELTLKSDDKDNIEVYKDGKLVDTYLFQARGDFEGLCAYILHEFASNDYLRTRLAESMKVSILMHMAKDL